MSISLWESGLSHYSTMWPCLIVSQHFSYHSSRQHKSVWEWSHEEVIADSKLYSAVQKS